MINWKRYRSVCILVLYKYLSGQRDGEEPPKPQSVLSSGQDLSQRLSEYEAGVLKTQTQCLLQYKAAGRNLV